MKITASKDFINNEIPRRRQRCISRNYHSIRRERRGVRPGEIKQLPDKFVTIDLNISYSKKHKLKIIKGFIPEVIEDKLIPG